MQRLKSLLLFPLIAYYNQILYNSVNIFLSLFKKITTMASKPTDYVNRAALGVNLAKNWLLSYPNYTVSFVTQADMEALSNDFSAKAIENSLQDSLKQTNSVALKNANTEISKAVTRLKAYIKDEYEVNLETHYAAYGLEKDGNNNYIIPTDNDRREQRLTILLQKLSEPNNPIATRKVGLAFWTDVIAQQKAAWNDSKAMKSRKAQLAEECRTMHVQSGEWISKLYKSIAIDFEKSKVASTRRAFGFLNETYK